MPVFPTHQATFSLIANKNLAPQSVVFVGAVFDISRLETYVVSLAVWSIAIIKVILGNWPTSANVYVSNFDSQCLSVLINSTGWMLVSLVSWNAKHWQPPFETKILKQLDLMVSTDNWQMNRYK